MMMMMRKDDYDDDDDDNGNRDVMTDVTITTVSVTLLKVTYQAQNTLNNDNREASHLSSRIPTLSW